MSILLIYDLIFTVCYAVWTYLEVVCLYIATTNPQAHYYHIHPITLPLWLLCTIGIIIYYF